MQTFVGNIREVPGGMPPLAWCHMVEEYQGQAWVQAIPWYLPSMEYLTPEELSIVRAKAAVWLDVTGEWPTDIDCWWEVRMARRRGDLPDSTNYVDCTINESGALVCGQCKARWAANENGDWGDGCTLCGTQWNKPEREEVRI